VRSSHQQPPANGEPVEQIFVGGGSPYRRHDGDARRDSDAAAFQVDGKNSGEWWRLPSGPTTQMGREEIIQPLIGEERHEERPSPAMVAAVALRCVSFKFR
jgi:hypothetical protein